MSTKVLRTLDLDPDEREEIEKLVDKARKENGYLRIEVRVNAR